MCRSTLCIYVYAYIYYIKANIQKDEGCKKVKLPISQKFTKWKYKIHEKRMKKTSMHVKITYPVDRQYMPYLPRVWRMDTDAC